MLFLVISCQKKETPLTFENKDYNATTLEACSNGICPEIEIHKLTASGAGELSDSINKIVDDVLVSNLVMDPDDSEKIKTFDTAIAYFISSYRTYRDEFPESGAGYEFQSKSSVSYENEELLCIVFENYSFWGGAHGYGSTTFVNVDKQTKKVLDEDNLFKDKAAFLKIAEEKFKNKYKIPQDANINSTGYFFENDTFILPSNIGFSENELILIYNPYEIAAYAEGQLTLKLPLSEVQEYLKPNL